MTHIVPRGWYVSANIFEELDPEATISGGSEITSSPTTPSVSESTPSSINPGVPVSSVQVVECPLDLVKENMEIKVLKNTETDVQGYQAINMRNPISRLSISGDEGKTWIGLNQEERSAAFLHPKQFNTSLNVTIRMDSWMGGSNVQVNMGLLPLQDGTLTSAKGNNVCRGNSNDHACSKLLANITSGCFFFFRQLQAYWDSLDSMEHMHSNLRWRDQAAQQTCCKGQRKLLHSR